jgi:hypothetical protein
MDRVLTAFEETCSCVFPGSATDIFDLLVSRPFCYLSKSRTQTHRSKAIEYLEMCMKSDRIIHFSYNIGGGYHASLDPGTMSVSFDVGLGELLLLYQIQKFGVAVQRIYGPGIKFYVTISNLNAQAVYDIPKAATEEYARRLRGLLETLRMSAAVVVIESEIADKKTYSELRRKRGTLTNLQKDKVERFLGRECTAGEASEYNSIYSAATLIAKRNFALNALPLAARGERTLCFRSFPGGDSKIQIGQVMLTTNKQGDIIPVLVTRGHWNCFALLKMPRYPVPIAVLLS